MRFDSIGRRIPEIPREVRAERGRRGWQNATLRDDKYWKPHEIEIIRKLYPTLGGEGLVERLGRPRKHICAKAKRMKVRFIR